MSKAKLTLKLIAKQCPKCMALAEALIQGKLNRKNQFRLDTVKTIGWNCKNCEFKQKVSLAVKNKDIKGYYGTKEKNN